MNNPGQYFLAVEQITVARTVDELSAIDGLEGLAALTLEVIFAYGSGGTTCVAVVQTSANEGDNWRDIARFDFSTSAAVKVCNLSGQLSKAITSYAVLASEGVFDGFLGDRLRAVITSTGTYVNTVLAISAVAR